jgi:hypothetical protein
MLTIALAMFIVVGTANAQTFYSITDGDWNSNSTWSTSSCTGGAAGDYPQTGDTVYICDDTVELKQAEKCGTLTIQQDGEVQTGQYELEIENPGGLTIDAKTTVLTMGS